MGILDALIGNASEVDAHEVWCKTFYDAEPSEKLIER